MSSLYNGVRLPQTDAYLKNMPRYRPEVALPAPAIHHSRRRYFSRRKIIVFILSCVAALFFCCQQARWATASLRPMKPSPLLDNSQIFVVSLPRRLDRRTEMERLRRTLAIKQRWEYLSATDSDNDKIFTIMQKVAAMRLSNDSQIFSNNSTRFRFQWPDHIDTLALNDASLEEFGNDFWTLPTPSDLSNLGSMPLLNAQKDFTISEYSANISEYRILTRARVACWDSHLSAIKRIAHSADYSTGIVLEDDVDMERDVRRRLQRLWPSLPDDWDMVFLGHCWSDESQYPAISVAGKTALHPSVKPKCTHAYALSRTGARRLYLHLVHPPFAYSRAIDQAFSWLIRSKRLKSYSVVPSVVVQRKVGGSDVTSGTGSDWRDRLQNGVLGRRN